MFYRIVIAFIFCILIATRAFAADLVDLGLPGGATTSHGDSVNNSGIVLMRAGTPYLRFPDGTYDPAGGAVLRRINDAGTTVGESGGQAVLRSLSGTYFFIPIPGNSDGRDLNDHGAAVGTSLTQNQAYYYEPSVGVTLIPNPPSVQQTQGRAVNNRGTVAGRTDTARTFVWSAGTGSYVLPTIGTQGAEPTDINDAGQIAGVMGGGGTSIKAVRWDSDGSLTVLPSVSGASFAFSINEQGDIVGESWTAGPRAYLWPATGGSLDLNDLLSLEQQQHWELQFTRGINDHMQIVGWGRFDPDGPGGPIAASTRGFMLTVPEPGATAAAALIMFALAFCRRSNVNDSAKTWHYF